VALPDGTKALNIGCGTTFAPGWFNLDNSPNARLSKIPGARQVLHQVGFLSKSHLAVQWPSDLIVRSATKSLPFGNSELDFVYTSHLLEHLSRQDGERLIREALRVLRPGGVLRIVVPDLLAQARAYIARLDADPSDAGAALDFLNTLQLSKPGHRDPHLWMYDAPSLAALLRECGFHDVELKSGGEGKTPDLDLLDKRRDASIHMEGVKP
jgi:SAM-dependent methyltransferase